MKNIYLLLFVVLPFEVFSQNTGVGTSNPLEFFSVGASSQFRVNASGNIVRINDVAYSFPASQATTGSILANDGTGNLTWTKVTTGNISATGTPSSSTYLRGDGSWQTPAGGSGVTFVGTTSGSASYSLAEVSIYSTTASATGLYLVTGYSKSNLGDQPYGIIRVKVNGTMMGQAPEAYIGMNNNSDYYSLANLSQVFFAGTGDTITITMESGGNGFVHNWSFTLVKL